MKNKKKINVIQAISNKSELPIDLLCGYPYMQLFGNREIIIEGVHGITKYQQDILSVNIANKKLCIRGRDLHLEYLNNNNMSLKGYIMNIEFE